MKFHFLVITLIAFTTDAFAGAEPPPPIPIKEPDVVSFSDAIYNFHVPNFASPVVVTLHMKPLDFLRMKDPTVNDMVISYGANSVDVGSEMLADITAPDLLWLRATALLDYKGHTVVAVYVYQTTHCDEPKGKGCGVVEFAWTVGGDLKKRDER
jgi:hypothetical protein